MKPWKLFGPTAKLTPVARMIMAEDIEGLEASRGKDWKLNEKAHFTTHIDDLAINLALIEGKGRVVDYLLSKKANLNVKGSPAITYAVRNSDKETIAKLLKAGARIDAVNNVKSNAYSCALYSERYDLLDFIRENGLAVDADGGKAFRQAVYGRQGKAVAFFLANGIDPNLQTGDMVHPNAPSAAQVAAQNNDFEMLKLLVEAGADVTRPDSNGSRPYLAAAQNNNVEMMEYLQAREPADWHDAGKKAELLRSHGVPQALIDFLQGDKLRITVNSENCEWLELLPLTSVFELNWQGGAYFMLLAGVDDYCDTGALAWSQREKRLVLIDQEHDGITKLGSWDEFIRDPGVQLEKQW